MRKFLAEVRTEVETLLLDNSTALITPERLRVVAKDILDSAAPGIGYFASATPVNFPVSGVGAVLPCPAPLFSSSIQNYVFVDPLPRTLTALAPAIGFSLMIQVVATVAGLAGRRLVLELFTGGVAMPFASSVTLTGPAEPATMSFVAFIPHLLMNASDIRLRSTNGNVAVDVLNSSVLAIIMPTETPL